MTSQQQPVDHAQWFEQEKPLLYDYLVRMTGDPDPASTTLLEVMQAVTARFRGEESDTKNLRLLLYRTARSFCADRWHRIPKGLIEQGYRGINDTRNLRALEGLISTFEAYQREAIFLKFRYGFQASEIASITGKSLPKVQDLINHGVLNIRKQFPEFSTGHMKQLPLFQIQDIEALSTMALSKILKVEERAEKFRFLKSVAWLLLILFALYYYLRHG